MLLFSRSISWWMEYKYWSRGFSDCKTKYDEAFTGDNLEEIKDKMRKIQKINRDKQLRSVEIQRLLKEWRGQEISEMKKKSILNLIDNGKELAEIFRDISQLDEEKISLLKKIINLR